MRPTRVIKVRRQQLVVVFEYTESVGQMPQAFQNRVLNGGHRNVLVVVVVLKSLKH